jgi:hypothetical protein
VGRGPPFLLLLEGHARRVAPRRGRGDHGNPWPAPPINLGRKIRDILKHVEPLPPEAGTPLSHYRRSATDVWNLLEYLRRAFDQLGSLKPEVIERHLGRHPCFGKLIP